MMSASGGLVGVLRTFGPDWLASHTLSTHGAKVWRAIVACRTAALGGHIKICDVCGKVRHVYHSCRNRHCPTCQTLRKQRWLELRRLDVLPVPYFHVVFSLPHALNPLIMANRTRLLGELFGTVNWVLQHFASDPQWKLRGQERWAGGLRLWPVKCGIFHSVAPKKLTRSASWLRRIWLKLLRALSGSRRQLPRWKRQRTIPPV